MDTPNTLSPYLKQQVDLIETALQHNQLNYIDLYSHNTENAVWNSAPPLSLQARGSGKVYHTLQDAFEAHNGRLLMLGAPGSGKTTTLLRFARDAFARALSHDNAPIPILARVSTWKPNQYPTINEWLIDLISPEDHDTINDLLAAGQCLLLLDGLDELDDGDGSAIELQRAFIDRLPDNNQILLTSRVRDYEKLTDRVRLNGAVTLQPYNTGQIRTYLSGVPKLFDATINNVPLLNFLRNPFTLSLFAEGFKDNPDSLPQQAHDTDGMMDSILGAFVRRRYDHEREKQSVPYSFNELLDMLSYAALGSAYYAGNRNEITSRHFGYLINADEIPALIDLCTNLGLIYRDENGIYRFTHLLLRDYFAFARAQNLLDQVSIKRRRMIATAFGRMGNPRGKALLLAQHFTADKPLFTATVQSLKLLGWVPEGDSEKILNVLAFDKQWELLAAKERPGVNLLFTAIAENTDDPETIATVLKSLNNCEAMIEATLQDTNPVIVGGAARAAAMLSFDQFRETILELAAINNDQLQENITLALIAYNDERAIPICVEHLHLSAIEAEIIAFLVQWDDASVPATQDQLLNNNAAVRRAAVEVLGKIGSDETIPDMIYLAEHDVDDVVRANAILALINADYTGMDAVQSYINGLTLNIKVESQQSLLSRGGRGVAARQQLLKMGSAVIPDVIAALHHPDPEQRQEVVMLLKDLDAHEAVLDLIARFPDEDENVQEPIIIALNHFADPFATETLIESLPLNSYRYNLFNQSIHTLISVYPASFLPLIDALQHNAPRIREGAARALASIQDPAATDALIAAAASESDRSARHAIIIALGNLRSSAAATVLIDSFDFQESQTDENDVWQHRDINRINSEMSNAIVDALTKLQPFVTDDLIAALNRPETRVQIGTIRALQRIDDPHAAAAIPTLRQMLLSHDQDVQVAAAETLSDFDDIDAIPVLLNLLDNPETPEDTLIAAAKALVRLDRANPDLFRLLIDQLPHASLNVQVTYINLLGQIGNSDAVQPILDLLQSTRREDETSILDANEIPFSQIRDNFVRAASLLMTSSTRALGRLNDPRTIPALMEMVTHRTAQTDDILLIAVLGSLRAVEVVPIIDKLLHNLIEIEAKMPDPSQSGGKGAPQFSFSSEYGRIVRTLVDALNVIDHPDAKAVLGEHARFINRHRQNDSLWHVVAGEQS